MGLDYIFINILIYEPTFFKSGKKDSCILGLLSANYLG